MTYSYSDVWGEARVEKINLYKAGETVLYNSSCGDYTCVYVAKVDIPASLNSPPPELPDYWQRQYCVENGRENKCVKKIECGPGRVVVDLGGEGAPNLICVPVESSVGVGPRGYESLR